MTDQLSPRSFLKAVGGRMISFHSALIEPAGGTDEALLLSQAAYHQDYFGPGVWWPHTRHEWYAEIGMKRKRLERARRHLRDRGLLEERLGKHPVTAVPCTFYLVPLGPLEQAFRSTQTRETSSGRHPNPCSSPVGPDRTNGSGPPVGRNSNEPVSRWSDPAQRVGPTRTNPLVRSVPQIGPTGTNRLVLPGPNHLSENPEEREEEKAAASTPEACTRGDGAAAFHFTGKEEDRSPESARVVSGGQHDESHAPAPDRLTRAGSRCDDPTGCGSSGPVTEADRDRLYRIRLEAKLAKGEEIRNPVAYRRTFTHDMPDREVRMALEVEDQQERRRRATQAREEAYRQSNRELIDGTRKAREGVERAREEAQGLLRAFDMLPPAVQEDLRALARARLGEVPERGRELLLRDALVEVLREARAKEPGGSPRGRSPLGPEAFGPECFGAECFGGTDEESHYVAGSA